MSSVSPIITGTRDLIDGFVLRLRATDSEMQRDSKYAYMTDQRSPNNVKKPLYHYPVGNRFAKKGLLIHVKSSSVAEHLI